MMHQMFLVGDRSGQQAGQVSTWTRLHHAVVMDVNCLAKTYKTSGKTVWIEADVLKPVFCNNEDFLDVSYPS